MIFIGSLSSCVSTKNIEFQVLKPAMINVGDDFSNIYIYCKEISQKDLWVSNKRDIIPFSHVKFSRTLKQNLEETPQLYRTRIRILDHDSLLSFKKKSPGILILVDTMRFDQVKKAYRNDFIYGVASQFGYSVYSKSRHVTVKKSFRKDTIWFQNTYLENGLSVFDRIQASISVCEQAAKECSDYIVPHWRDISRKYYYQTGTFSKAYKMIQKNELDNALKVLEDCYDKKARDPECRVKALYNMAIIYELKDDFEKAYTLADSSLKIQDNELSREYCQILYKRKLDKEVLDWQLK